MIKGIGCDIVEHAITAKLKWESDIDLLRRIFSEKELVIYESKKSIKFLCGRFAAKEAVVKCLGTGMQDGISLSDIQILQGETGKAEIELLGKIKNISDEFHINLWHISITHSTSFSMAFVIAEQS